jgi:hemerythrin-like domain-containing protein
LTVHKCSSPPHRNKQENEKENEILYPMADGSIPETTQQALLADFDKVEEERVGHGKHEEFHRLMDQLRGIYIG